MCCENVHVPECMAYLCTLDAQGQTPLLVTSVFCPGVRICGGDFCEILCNIETYVMEIPIPQVFWEVSFRCIQDAVLIGLPDW